MAFLGNWLLTETLTVYVQTINPDTGAVWPADTFPTYRLYHLPTGTPLVTGTYALLDPTGATGTYVARIPLTSIAGFATGQTYGLRTAITIVGATEAQEDTFNIPPTPHTIPAAKVVRKAQPMAMARRVTITPARVRWQAAQFRQRTITIAPAQLRWRPNSMFPLIGFTPARVAWRVFTVPIRQDFPFRETTPALTFLPD